MVDSTPTGVGAAVDDQVDAAAQIGEHVLRGGRRDVAGAVGRGRDHRPAEGGEDVARDRMIRHAHRDAVEAGGGEVGDRAVCRLRQHQRQRPRPERRREPLGRGVEARELPRRRQVGAHGRSAD